jgi:hypothetical protein
MPDALTAPSPGLDRLFGDYEQSIRVANYKVGCLARGRLHAGRAWCWTYYVYGQEVMLSFLPSRCGCLALLLDGLLWLALHYWPDTRDLTGYGAPGGDAVPVMLPSPG